MRPSRCGLFLAWVVGAVAPLAGEEGRPPTFYRDVAPILYQHCASCHRPEEVGPFPLLSYEDARKRARQLAQVTAEQLMPPWKPSAGPEVFKNARTLTESQRAVFRRWAEAGAPAGDPQHAPAAPEFPRGWHLGEPDLILQVEEPFVVPAEGPDVYVHFVLPLEFRTTKYIKACQVLPSNRRVAHHGVPILDGGGAARKLAAKQGGKHYQNSGGPGFIPRGFLPGYAPGQVTRSEPADNRGFSIGPGVDLILQMHYHPTGKVERDQPQVGLYFTQKPPERNPCVFVLANNDIAIPPGAKEFRRQDAFKLPVDFEVRDVWGHMHLIGKELKVWAELPSGKTRDLLHIPHWDFNWQDSYHFQKPFVLPRGTVVKAEFLWDNSADNPRNPHHPPRLISWGEGSSDEMSGVIVGGVTVKPWEEIVHWLAVLGHYWEVESRAQEAKQARFRESLIPSFLRGLK